VTSITLGSKPKNSYTQFFDRDVMGITEFQIARDHRNGTGCRKTARLKTFTIAEMNAELSKARGVRLPANDFQAL